MNEIISYQCEYCKKTSLYKSNTKRHEKECFYNPDTQSCATCLWSSKTHGFVEIECFQKKFPKPAKGEKPQLKYGCPDWQSCEYIMIQEDIDENPEIVEKLIEGDKDYFKELNERNRTVYN
jgi:hypothetical protein